MHRTILTSVMFVLIPAVCLSSAARTSAASTPVARTPSILSLQAASGVEGNWQGALDVGAFKLRLVLKISKSADGKLTATVDSLDQNAKDLVVDTITLQDGTLNFEMKALGASYRG